jgi:NAD(P)-dependent dehydrogenase (short-subunit alcohol dehydrogenase family)
VKFGSGYVTTPLTMQSDKIHASAGKSDAKEKELVDQVPLKRAGEAPEVASVIAFLLGDESKFITGAAYTIDGGLTC